MAQVFSGRYTAQTPMCRPSAGARPPACGSTRSRRRPPKWSGCLSLDGLFILGGRAFPALVVRPIGANAVNSNQELHVVLGSGPLGLAVVRALVARGRRVRVVNRSGRAEVPSGVEVTPGDAYRPDAVREVTRGATAVYQCAQPPYTQWPEKFPAFQASILEGVAANGAKLIVAENLYMYGAVAGPLREDLPYAATTRKGRTRAQMAESLQAAHRAGKVRVASGRGADFFGPHVLASALGSRVFAPALQGKTASALGNLDQPHTYTFIDDFGEALAVLGEHEEALGQAWHVPNAPTVTTRQVITMIFEEAGRPPRMNGMGKLMLRVAGLFIPDAREMVELAYEFDRPFVADSSKYVQAFGDHATPLRAAIRQTVAWYRTQAVRK
jgi:nucleoside-diphosphate-sugar epimerase